MREFFKPWRRKIGVVTLVMAFVFAAGWVRSFRTEDFASRLVNARYWSLISKKGGIFIICQSGMMVLRFDPNRFEPKDVDHEERTQALLRGMMERSPSRSHKQTPVKPPVEARDTKTNFCGFEFGTKTSGVAELESVTTTLRILYWSIVLPLTMLSAWLLLSKPRPAKPQAELSP